MYFNCRIFFFDQSVITLEQVSGDPALDLSMDGIKEGGQVLLFADTRKRGGEHSEKSIDLYRKENSRGREKPTT